MTLSERSILLITIRLILFVTVYVAICFSTIAMRSPLLAATSAYFTALIFAFAAARGFTASRKFRRRYRAFAFAGIVVYLFDHHSAYSLSTFVTNLYMTQNLPTDLYWAETVYVPYTETIQSSYTVTVPQPRDVEQSVFRSLLSVASAFALTLFPMHTEIENDG